MSPTPQHHSTTSTSVAPQDGHSGHLLSRRHAVLVAEDDGDMRALMCAELHRDGYDPVAVADGGQLLDYLRAAAGGAPVLLRPDLLVTDLRMPYWCGFDALTFLGAMAWRLPVIVVTAFGSGETHDSARRLGAATVLDKPFALSELRRVVFEALWPRDTGRGTSASLAAW